MSRFVMDMPDDFKNEMLRRKAKTGVGFRFQVINALRKEFGWDESALPLDPRTTLFRDFPPPQTNGHTPKNQPLDSRGLPDFSYGMDRAEEAESFMRGRTTHPKPDDDDYVFGKEFDDEPSSGPAIHPDDLGKKIPTGTEGKEKMLKDLQREIEEEF